MTENFIGKAVSIKCKNNLGIFQGHIKTANPQKITIVKAFRNGVPLKKPDIEITIEASNIETLELIAQQPTAPTIARPTPIKQVPPGVAAATNGFVNMKIKNGYRGSPPKQPLTFATKSPVTVKTIPMDVPNGSGVGTPFKNDNRRNRNGRQQQQRHNRNSAFGTPVDDPMMDEDFDFEKNLALFDKQAIWDEIENGSERPDLLRQTGSSFQVTLSHLLLYFWILISY